MAERKISELESTTDLQDLYTIGTDKNNNSKKVKLQFVKEAADYANAQGDYAKEVADNTAGNTGVNDYPAFSASGIYSAGDVVNYNGKLYRFTAPHQSGAWNGNDVVPTSINAESQRKLTELSAEINGGKNIKFSTSNAIPAQTSRGFEVLQSLEKGKAYIFDAPVTCNIEYYTADGGYKHLFDAQSKVEFVCPSDYDTTKPQYIVNVSQSECNEFSVYTQSEGMKDALNSTIVVVEELQGVIIGQSEKKFEGELVASGVRGYELFQSLEKGKTYAFKSDVRCNIEYYTANGGYKHLFDAQNDIEFVCPSDYDTTKPQYIANTSSKAGVFNVFTQGTGLSAKVDEIGNDVQKLTTSLAVAQINIDANTKATQGQLKNYIAGADYTRIAGLIRNDGTIDTSATSFWYSTPIEVQVGDILRIVKLYNNSSVGEVWETDSENSYHKMLVKAENEVRDIEYVVNRPMYINVNYLMGDTNYQVSIRRGGVDSKRDEAISSSIKKNRNAMPTYVPNRIAPVINNATFVEDMSAAVNARFERQKMLNEVAAFKRKGIAPVRSGYCGYDDRGGNMVHNTISWEIYENGILYISGYGKMYDYVKGVSQGFNAAELDAMAKENPYMWYYYLVKDGVTYSEYDDNHNVMYTYPAPFKHRVYNEAEGEKNNSETGKYVGYATPWYSYRSEIDFVEYTSQEHYDEFNPNHIYYDRICIDEDLSNGGITRIGDWAFYRATCDSLVLPSKLTEIGRWGVRYSPTIRTLVMDNLVTTIEDHGISRMENMNHLVLSSAIRSIDFYGLSQNDRIRLIELPSVTQIVDYSLYNNLRLESIAIGKGLAVIPKFICTSCKYFRALNIPEGVQSIGAFSFSYMELDELHIPASVTSLSIGNSNKAFEGTQVNSLYLNNEYTQTLLKDLPTFDTANYLFIKDGVKVNSYILSNYDCTGIHNGYKRFVKRPTL